MPTPAIAEAVRPFVDRQDDPQVVGVACLLLAVEACDARAFRCCPLAHTTEGADHGFRVAACVMIDVGDGPLPFPLGVVRLAVACLRADPPFTGWRTVADALDHAADDAEASVTRLLGSLN